MVEPPGAVVTVCQEPSPRRNVLDDGVPVALMPPTGNPVALVRVPDDGVPKAPLKVTKAPAEPTSTPSAVRTPVPVVVVDGATPAPPPITSALAASAPDDAHVDELEKYGIPPEVPATVRASVPAVVIGDPATEINPPVNVCATLVTPVPAGVAQVPSPHQNVEEEALDPLLRFATGRFPVTPVERGSPVAFVKTAADGVPKAGVVNVGELVMATEPVPEIAYSPRVPALS